MVRVGVRVRSRTRARARAPREFALEDEPEFMAESGRGSVRGHSFHEVRVRVRVRVTVRFAFFILGFIRVRVRVRVRFAFFRFGFSQFYRVHSCSFFQHVACVCERVDAIFYLVSLDEALRLSLC